MPSSVLQISSDALFDRELPRYVRDRSRQYWTPVAVAARVAASFREWGAGRVLDVGCGPGKFCVVAACLQPELQFHGIDRRQRLVRLGTRLARRFGADNVRLSAGDVTQMQWEHYDGFYFFNPFAESTFEACERFDDTVDLSMVRFGSELLRVESLLEKASPGTVVVTYHGLGGPIPASYELVADERAGSDRIRTWVQGPARSSRWAWLETLGGVRQLSRRELHDTLSSLICGGKEL